MADVSHHLGWLSTGKSAQADFSPGDAIDPSPVWRSLHSLVDMDIEPNPGSVMSASPSPAHNRGHGWTRSH
jgi:hypothetical protein